MHFNRYNIPEYSWFSFTIFFDFEEIIFLNFNISENNKTEHANATSGAPAAPPPRE